MPRATSRATARRSGPGGASRVLLAAGIAALAAALVLVLSAGGVTGRNFTNFENQTYDYRAWLGTAGSPRAPLDDVVIVDIDERTTRLLGPIMRWPRSHYAGVLDYLREGGVRAVGFDLFFVDPDSMGEAARDSLARRISEELSGESARPRSGAARGAEAAPDAALLGPLPENQRRGIVRDLLGRMSSDRLFAEAVARLPGVYLPMGETDSASVAEEAEAGHAAEPPPDSRYHFPGGTGLGFVEVRYPMPVTGSLRGATRTPGFAFIVPDADGVTRRAPTFFRSGEASYPNFSLALALDVLGVAPDAVRFEAGAGLHAGGLLVPTDGAGQMLLWFPSRPDMFRHISFSDIVEERVPREYFRDRIVLVGSSLPGLRDVRTVPVGPDCAGVELHALLIHDLLNRAWVTVPGPGRAALMIFVLSLVAAVLGLALDPRRSLPLILLFVAAYLLYAQGLYQFARAWIEVVRPVTAAGTAAVFSLAARQTLVERQRRRLREILEKKLPRKVVQELVNDPGGIRMGGEKRVITVMFSDLRSSTRIAETLGPEEFVRFINNYLEGSARCVFAEEGTLDKFQGDGVMCFFGAPHSHADHAARACRAALAMVRATDCRHLVTPATGEAVTVGIGVGINTGDAVVGNVGSRERFDYSAIGDAVNVAARLEPMNKEFGTAILVGPGTRRDAGGAFLFRELGRLPIRGREERLEVSELLAEAPGSPEERELSAAFARGLAAYRRAGWAEARLAFEACLAIRAGDGPARYFMAATARASEGRRAAGDPE